MAKTPIGLGQFSGRVGGVVYAVQAGRQVVRAYQPVVSNPKSTAQSIQRAKGNLVGRISKITPWQILEGLGDNKFSRRSRFLRLLLQKATAGQAAGNPSQFNAKLADADFVFSEGNVIPLFTVSGTPSLATTNASVTIIPSETVTASQRASQGILVVLVLKNQVSDWYEVQYKFLAPADLSETSTVVTFQHRAEGRYTACFYQAPFATVDGSALRTRTGILTSTPTSLDALLEVGNGASPVVWGSSFLMSTAQFPATSAVSAKKTPKSE